MSYKKSKLTSKLITNVLKKAGVLLKSPKSLGDKSIFYNDLQFDTRKIKRKRTLFVIKGRFRVTYLKKELFSYIDGLILNPKFENKNIQVPCWFVSDTQIALASLSAAFFGHPEKKLTILGITGTKGKTSAAYMVYKMLDKLTHHQVALFSTIDTIITKNFRFKSELTTPESYELFLNMKRALDNKKRYLVMEVSSQSYLKERVFGIHFKVGSFLNISPDHIGINEHPNFADYLAKKKMLAENSDIFVSNIDDKHGKEFLDHASLYGGKTISVSSSNPRANVFFKIFQCNLDKSIFDIKYDNKHTKRYILDIPGDFNVYNASIAITMIYSMGFNAFSARDALAKLKIPGRMAKLKSKRHGLVIVDYAHNGESLEKLLVFLRSQHPKGKIILVIGSPGNKGQDRRQQFGKVISRYVDISILTTDDPGTENPHLINNEIRRAIYNPKVKLYEILDRKLAIKKAISLGNNNDLVILAAKGDDAFQKTNHKNVPYLGDNKVALKALDYLE